MAGGGFGGGPWGGGPWGGSGSGDVGTDLDEVLTLSEALDIVLPFQVVGAISLSPFLVRVDFSHIVEPSHVPNFNPGNYPILPTLTVTGVSPGPTTRSVLLDTLEQGAVVYTVEVFNAESSGGDPIDLLNNDATFAGFPIAPTFFATAQSRTKVQFSFAQEMTQNFELLDPASYSITDLQGTPVPITSVALAGPSPVSRISFTLGAELDPGGYYVANILTSAVVTIIGVAITPPTDLFQWGEMQEAIRHLRPMEVRIQDFSGEVSGGLLGQPLGQVFFSPSLDAAAPNSSIQVDSLAVCTRAFDVYTVPVPPDPPLLATFAPNAPASTLGGNTTDAVLFAGFNHPNRLQEAQINLTDNPADTYGGAADGPADATLDEPLDPNFISLLNNPFWETFGGSGATFITADNLAPIPPGSSSNINLQP